MSARQRKLKELEKKIRDTCLVIYAILASAVAIYAMATAENSALVVFLFDAVGWVFVAIALLFAIVLLVSGIKGEAPRVYSIGWAFALVGLPFLVAHVFSGATRASAVQLYLFGNLCTFFLLCISTTTGTLSPE